jgi:hypothetical protein
MKIIKKNISEANRCHGIGSGTALRTPSVVHISRPVKPSFAVK